MKVCRSSGSKTWCNPIAFAIASGSPHRSGPNDSASENLAQAFVSHAVAASAFWAV
jgi:hypothetical protein